MTRETAPPMERALDLAASPARAWRALTDAQELSVWLGPAMPRVVAARPDAWLTWAWGSDDATDPVTTTVSLAPRAEGGTRLTLREDGIVSAELRAAHSTAWLDRLGRLLGHLATQPFEAGIRRTYRLRSAPERVWRAFTDERELGAWWGGTGRLDIRPGVAGWWEWPGLGRFAMVIDAVEPVHYLAWRWATVADRLVADADQVLRTEWALEAGAGGGTVLHLLESGFTGPEDHRLNDGGWDGDILPALRTLLGEAG